MVDFDDAGHVVGIDIQHASERIDLSSVESKHLPLIHRTPDSELIELTIPRADFAEHYRHVATGGI